MHPKIRGSCRPIIRPRAGQRFSFMESLAGIATDKLNNINGPVSTVSSRMNAFAELTKPRITFLVVLTAAAGFCMGSPQSIDFLRLLNLSIGVALLSSGIATLNQYMER